MLSGGCVGKVLWIDLSSGRITTSRTEDLAQHALGGRGINTWILLTQLPPSVDPLGAENVLILGAGPLVGTSCPGSSRLSIDAKSPITGGIGSASVGGYFSAELKWAGFDHVVIRGRASRPSFVHIQDGHVAIEGAQDLWGQTTWATSRMLLHKLGSQHEVLAIGPAGENCVRGAAIVTRNGRAAGRCGLGAVMGSKNLKAIAVRGSGGVSVAHPERFARLVVGARRQLALSRGAQEVRRYGTYSHPEVHNLLGFMPVRYFEDEYWDPDKIQRLHPRVFQSTYEMRRMSCSACPLFCSHVYRIPRGPFAGFVCEGFKANTQKNFAARFDIDDPNSLIYLHGLCNELGLDEDFASCVIGWAIACFEAGLIDSSQTDGRPLRWGDPSLVEELVLEIAHRKGLGAILAKGTERASRELGLETDRLAVRVKGQESMESMRAAKGWALGCAVSTRGGTHTRGANLVEFMGVSDQEARTVWNVDSVPDGTSYGNKAPLVVYYERLHAVLDSLGVCFYMSNWIAPDMLGFRDVATLFEAATGRSCSRAEIIRQGERMHLLEKLFNIQHVGWTREDDVPPARFLTEPIRSGPQKGERIDYSRFQKMLDEYYNLHNWDKERGWPTEQALREAGLSQFSSLVRKTEEGEVMTEQEPGSA